MALDGRTAERGEPASGSRAVDAASNAALFFVLPGSDVAEVERRQR